jgi:hypothetical protein
MELETIELGKSARVEKLFNPLPSGELSALVLLSNAIRPSAFEGLPVHLFEPFTECFVVHEFSNYAGYLTQVIGPLQNATDSLMPAVKMYCLDKDHNLW